MIDPFATGRQDGIVEAQRWVAAKKPVQDLLEAAVDLSQTKGKSADARYQAGYGFGMRTVLEPLVEKVD